MKRHTTEEIIQAEAVCRKLFEELMDDWKAAAVGAMMARMNHDQGLATALQADADKMSKQFDALAILLDVAGNATGEDHAH